MGTMTTPTIGTTAIGGCKTTRIGRHSIIHTGGAGPNRSSIMAKGMGITHSTTMGKATVISTVTTKTEP